ncbi:MAG: hypothetical protein K6G15_09990 [Desulfovibrio sp.]|nr:hypothetical protein [Desulfovibrio sp.]
MVSQSHVFADNALFTTAKHKTLLILHVDDDGIDGVELTKRRLCKGKFRTMISDTEHPLVLTREQPKRLVFDGRYALEWQNANLQVQMEAIRQAGPISGTLRENFRSNFLIFRKSS